MFKIEKHFYGESTDPYRFTINNGRETVGPWTVWMGHGHYLHRDLTVRPNAYSFDQRRDKTRYNESVAWYNTREAAREAIRLYRAKNDPRFYIGRSTTKGEFYAVYQVVDRSEKRYLHKNGYLHFYAIGDGWFQTEEEVIKAIALYRKLNKQK